MKQEITSGCDEKKFRNVKSVEFEENVENWLKCTKWGDKALKKQKYTWNLVKNLEEMNKR